MTIDRSRKDEIREYMRLHGVKYNVARRALERDSAMSESSSEAKWPSLAVTLNRLLGEPLMPIFGELPNSTPGFMHVLEDLYVIDFAFVDDDFTWFKVEDGNHYEAFEGTAQFDLSVGGWATLDDAIMGFESGILRPVSEPFDASAYDPRDMDDRVEVAVDRYFPASASMTVIRLEGSEHIEDQHLTYVWEVPA